MTNTWFTNRTREAWSHDFLSITTRRPLSTFFHTPIAQSEVDFPAKGTSSGKHHHHPSPLGFQILPFHPNIQTKPLRRFPLCTTCTNSRKYQNYPISTCARFLLCSISLSIRPRVLQRHVKMCALSHWRIGRKKKIESNAILLFFDKTDITWPEYSLWAGQAQRWSAHGHLAVRLLKAPRYFWFNSWDGQNVLG